LRDVKVTDLRSHLPAFLAAVQGGEEIRILSRGKGCPIRGKEASVRRQGVCVIATIACLVAGVPGPFGSVARAAESPSWRDVLEEAHPRPLLEKAWTMRARERLWFAGIHPDAATRRQALKEAIEALEQASRASTDPRERERLTRLIGKVRELGDSPGTHPSWRPVLASLAGIVRDRTRELDLLREAIATPSATPAPR